MGKCDVIQKACDMKNAFSEDALHVKVRKHDFILYHE